MENEIRIASPYRFAEDEAELVFTDAEGRFAASWCNGRLGFASLVLPRVDDEGRLLERWPIPMFDLSGKEITGAERESCKRFLSDSWYLLVGQNEPALDYHSSRYPLTYVVAMLLVEEAGREWTADRFLCADAGSRFESQSSHRFRCGDAIVGEAEMFTWHRAQMRLAWDLHANGDLESGAIPFEVGAGYRRGGFHFELVGIEQREFRRKGEAGKGKLAACRT